MIKSKDELLTQIREALGENSETDAAISLYENVTDTYADFEDKASDTYREKYEDLKARYRERFFQSDGKEPEEHHKDPTQPEAVRTFESLFKTEN